MRGEMEEGAGVRRAVRGEREKGEREADNEGTKRTSSDEMGAWG